MRRQTLGLWRAVQEVAEEAEKNGFRTSTSVRQISIPAAAELEFDQIVRDEDLRNASKQLFLDKHYARSVEEAYKCLNNEVKRRSGKALDGADLMRTAFTPKNPLLKLNKLRTRSQQDEQLGYMEIFAGCMTGIRNPRVHEHHLKDSREEAHRLLSWADHLMGYVKGSIRTRAKRAKTKS